MQIPSVAIAAAETPFKDMLQRADCRGMSGTREFIYQDVCQTREQSAWKTCVELINGKVWVCEWSQCPEAGLSLQIRSVSQGDKQ